MKLGINPFEASTLRGAIRILTAAVGAYFIYIGKDVSELLLFSAAISGMAGVGIKDGN